MKKNLLIAIWFTLVTTIIFGVIYSADCHRPFSTLVCRQGQRTTDRAQRPAGGISDYRAAFTGPGYFHSRPVGGRDGERVRSDFQQRLVSGPTNKALLDRVNDDVQKLRVEKPGSPIPVDLVTSSGSGLDRTFPRPLRSSKFLGSPASAM